MSNKSITMVMAHPDDEILWGWPIFFDDSYDVKIIMCSTDANNPEREWCRRRKEPLQELCQRYNVQLTCIDYNSGFYKTPSRQANPPLLADVYSDIATRVAEIKTDYIFSHNPIGEYGHFDHRMLFNICLENANVPVLITNMCMESNWPSYEQLPNNLKIFYQRQIKKCSMPVAEYREARKLYADAGVWTWSRGEIEDCAIFLIDP